MKRIAGIDIGTNSVLYSLFEVKGKSIFREEYLERHSPQIGRKLAGSRRPMITEGNYGILKRILYRNIRHAIREGAIDILVAATNPFRLARNGREVKDRLEADLRCTIDILSSDQEAYLSFLAAAGKLNRNQTVVVMDIGGGSTELVVYRGDKRLAFVSIPEGAVSLTEKFNSRLRVELENFARFEKYLSKYDKKANAIRLYLGNPIKLVGGTTTALACLKNENVLSRPRGVILSQREIADYASLLARRSLTSRRQLLKTDKKRAEIIFAGAFWCNYLFKVLEIKKADAVPRGLRHGMVMDFLQQQ
jgi:exopolyphosphatase/guanosine-5'-triphosphate,3'-diphosphate pyrophosphatase